KRYRVAFLADDGSRVNGILAMPGDEPAPASLAIALHPMGSDQSIWWRAGKPLFGGEITARLRQRGHAVLALDARWHGERGVDGVGPRDLLAFAHGENPRPYHQVIVDSVRDYRLALKWAERQDDLDTRNVFVVGYSMGAQMSLLLAAAESRVTSVLAMVPPYVGRRHSPVAPRNHVGAITDASVMLIAGREDPYSSRAQTEQVFATIPSPDKELALLPGGHLLPESYVNVALSYVDERTGVERR
ncbi:MAG: alpha/beta fold hydrolase, partial [Pseudomonadota bacterium]